MPSILNFKNGSRKRRAYSSSFLNKELYKYACNLTDQDFLIYQMDFLRDVIPHFTPDCSSVCLASHKAAGEVAHSMRYATFNQDKDTIKKYAEFSHLDRMDPTNFLRPGNAIFNTHFKSIDQWYDDEFYQGFKVPLGLNHTVIVSFCFPFRIDLRIRFSYQTLFPNMFSNSVSKHEVEFYTLPFYYAWLHRHGAIDESTLKEWLDRLCGITPLGLSLLRDMCTSQHYVKATTAQRFNISKRVIENQFQKIHGMLCQKTGLDEAGSGYRSQLVDLTNHYGFLRFSGYSLTDEELREALRSN